VPRERQLSKLYFSRLDDAAGGAKLSPAALSPPASVTAARRHWGGRDGSIFAAWRHVYPGNIRDIASRSPATAAAPCGTGRVSDDQWVLTGVLKWTGDGA